MSGMSGPGTGQRVLPAARAGASSWPPASRPRSRRSPRRRRWRRSCSTSWRWAPVPRPSTASSATSPPAASGCSSPSGSRSSPPATWCSTSPCAASAPTSGYPFADILYLAAYPLLAVGLWHLAGHGGRETTVDSAIVAAAPARGHLAVGGHAGARRARAARRSNAWSRCCIRSWTSCWWWSSCTRCSRCPGGHGGVASVRRARVDARRRRRVRPARGRRQLRRRWPARRAVADLLPAARGRLDAPPVDARAVGGRTDAGLVRTGRARMVVLGAALFAVPAVVVLDGADERQAVVLTAISPSPPRSWPGASPGSSPSRTRRAW